MLAKQTQHQKKMRLKRTSFRITKIFSWKRIAVAVTIILAQVAEHIVPQLLG